MKYAPVIGLEIHIQLKTASKMFCSSPNQTENVEPNTNICEVCTGQPGSLPVANREAIRKAVMMGLSLGCKIPEYSKFDRKNYFYPDLPKGYQISQFDQPVCGRGEMDLAVPASLSLPPNGRDALSSKAERRNVARPARAIRITRAHLEEDAGKLVHPAGADYSLVDLNRAGVPLLEIVTEPDFRAPSEARIFLQQLRTLARYLGVSDADMEKGHMRCDANISIRQVPDTKDPEMQPLPPYKVEIKNMNSFKSVEEALSYEIERQTAELAAGKALVTETRGWSDGKRETLSQRIKEGSEDYRYFPEPDLPVLHLTEEYVEEIRRQLPELPAAKYERFLREYALPPSIAWQVVENRKLAAYFEEVVSELEAWFAVEHMTDEAETRKAIGEAAMWCIGPLTEILNAQESGGGDMKVTAENFAELLKMIHKGEISKTAAKQVFASMFETGDDPSTIVEEQGLAQVSDTSELEKVVDEVIASNPAVVADVRAGKMQAMGFLVGRVMQATRGKANPQVVNELFVKKFS